MKVRVPVLGTVGKSLLIDSEATKGATIGTNLFLSDGSAPTLEQLRALLGTGGEAPSVANTLWKLIREIPANVLEVEALATSGFVVRQVDGNWITRSLAVEADGLLQIAQPAGEAGNPTLGAADIAALSVWGRSANSAGKPAPITAGADFTLLRRSGNTVGFGTITSAYVSDFVEAAQDAVFGVIGDSARIDFAYDDPSNAFTADLIAGSVANSYLANMADSTIKGRAVGAGAGAPTDLSGAQAAAIIGYTAADVLAKLLTVDGAGSGLDADLLDGQSSAAFLSAASYTAADVLAKLLTVDGSGSGLDADLLDGISSAGFFQTAHELLAIDGTAGAPAYSFALDPDTGFFRQGSNSIGVSFNATEIIRLNGNGVFVLSALPAYWLQETDQAADEQLWRFSVNARSFQVRALNDAANLAADGLLITRGTGPTPSITAIQLGNTTDNPTLLVAGTGFKTFRGQIGVPNSTAGAPGFTFENDPDTGLYRIGTNQLGVSAAGAMVAQLDANGIGIKRAPTSAFFIAAAGSAGTGALLLEDTAVADSSRPFVFIRSNGGSLELGNSNRSGTSTTGTTVRALIDSSGRTLFGGITASTQIGSLAGLTVQIGAASSVGASIARYSADTTGPVFAIGKSRGPTLGAAGAVVSGDTIARWQFAGADGTDVTTLAAQIQVTVASVVATDVVPGQIEFLTANTAGTLQEVMRLTTDGTLAVRDGSVGTPSITLLNDPDTGLYRIGANQLGITAGGALVLDIAQALLAITATTIRLNTTTATTVGAAGAAAALPAAPLGYLSVNVGGTAAKIPYYTA